MKIYNKLIRDKIPHIIEANGSEYEVRVLDQEEYRIKLNEKLQEELLEYRESDDDINELADLVEVIYAIVESKGHTIEEFEKLRLFKREVRGGFEQKLLLISTSK
jgi:predicted house-cleaning noncanonical NTP pyrophosphatase (MazG superfamily)